MKSCCSPSREASKGAAPIEVQPSKARRAREVAEISGGQALVGTDYPIFPLDGEGPLRRKKIAAFAMDTTTVTNARFQEFVTETGYVTEAERFGNSLVFQGLLPKGTPPSRAISQTPWWRVIAGANWRNPVGPDSAAMLQMDHPVTHVSWNDATAFARWAGGRLPTEAEWEHAARGKLNDSLFPWGDAEPNDIDYFPCNIWQGRFPHQNTARDGYSGTAPAQSFAPNGNGLYNMVGNVWEMTSEVFKVPSLKKEVAAAHAGKKGYKLSKGGSFLCHRSYCYRYRIAARNSTSPDTSTCHTGFRLVYPAHPGSGTTQ